MAWLEVETKIRVKNPNDMRKRIQKIARLVKKEARNDDYFALRRGGYPKKAFRIRATQDEFVVNFKKKLKRLWSKDIVVKEEFEFNLRGREHVHDLLALFKDLGFVEFVKKHKLSESYRYKKDKRLVIELNKVKHLGFFVEIEYLSQKHEVQKAKKRIREALKLLGVGLKEIDNTGYTKMLYDKGIKDRRYFLK